MLTIHNGNAHIYSSDTTKEQWADLCKALESNSLERIYFHYVSYSKKVDEVDLLFALSACSNLKTVEIKGSNFSFEPNQDCGVGLAVLLKGLESCPNIEHLIVRNYTSEEMYIAFENLAYLIEKNNNLKTLSIWHSKISSPKFKLLCDILAKNNREIILDFESAVSFSVENRRLLKGLLETNKLIKVSKAIETILEETDIQQPASEDDSYLRWHVLNGFVLAIGATAVFLGFAVLNVTTCGAAGVIVGCIGVAALLVGVGMFASNFIKCSNDTPDPAGEALFLSN
ncbi:MAG: hypothetical protein H0T84_12735 [Tatlockia sp.]|nr:hypothetical protein [Tatlockia sp.]